MLLIQHIWAKFQEMGGPLNADAADFATFFQLQLDRNPVVNLELSVPGYGLRLRDGTLVTLQMAVQEAGDMRPVGESITIQPSMTPFGSSFSTADNPLRRAIPSPLDQ